jgi:Zn-dependent M16 (insulinase) family peptidase
MVSAVTGMVHFMSGSMSKAQNTLVAAVYLKRLKALLRDRPETVISDLEEIRRALARFENFRVGVIADLEKLDHPVATWKEFSDRAGSSDRLEALGSAAAHLSDAGKQPGRRAYLVPMTAIDSSYSLHTARGLDSPNHPQLPALLVAVDYLAVGEGPLWRAVRGSGLAYGTSFQNSVQSGLISYSIYSSPAASKAFVASKKVVEDLISGATPFETAALEGAVSKIVLGFAHGEAGMASAGRASFVNQVILGVPKDYKAQILRKVRAVTVDDIKAVLKDVILPVFQPETSNLVVTCASGEAEVSILMLTFPFKFFSFFLPFWVKKIKVWELAIREKVLTPVLIFFSFFFLRN